MKTRITLLIFSLIVSSSVIFADTETQAGLKYEDLLPTFQQFTPEAASLGRFGNIGTSEYTGTPNISIPLHTVSVGEVSVPLSLSYDASGIKVSQEATIVGLGWNLSHGGRITRIVCGRDDNLPQYYGSRADFYRSQLKNLQTKNYVEGNLRKTWYEEFNGEIFYRSVGFADSKANLDSGIVCANQILAVKNTANTDMYDLLRDIQNGGYEPDIFQASFCGHSFSFVLYGDFREPVIIGDDATKYSIEYTYGGFCPLNFTITDDKGISYFFNGYEENPGYRDSYYLEQITGPDGKDGRSAINFTYRKGTSLLLTPTTLYQTEGLGIYGFPAPAEVQSGYLDKRSNKSNNSMYKVYPESIETDKEKIMFSYGSREDVQGAQKLDKIAVYSKNGGKKIKEIELCYEYFQEERRGERLSDEIWGGKLPETYIPKRLKLKQIKIGDSVHKFEYNNFPLPYKTTLAQDYWGYYNGINNKELLGTPKYQKMGTNLKELVVIGNANRYSSEMHCKVGVLERITYPTGGYTDFEYESNRFSDPDGFCYPTANNFITGTIDNGHPTEKKFLGVVSAFPADSVSKEYPGYSIQTVDFEVTGKELEYYNHIHSVNKEVEEYMDVTLFFRASTRSTYHNTYANRNTQYCLKVFLRFWGTDDDGGGYDYQFTVAREEDNFEKEIKLKLKKGKYHLMAKVEHVDYDRTAHGYISATCVGKAPINPGKLGMDMEDVCGPSVGAGLRIKTLYNYDAEGTFLGGTSYKYEGGVLLVPTFRTEKMILEVFAAKQGDLPNYMKGAFYFSGSQSQYPSICSYGSPEVGYSKVEKSCIDRDYRVSLRIVSEYENCGYRFVLPNNLKLDTYIQGLSAKMFYYPNFGRNGLLKKQNVFDSDGIVCNQTECFYDSCRYSPIYYSQAFPLFISSWFFGEVWYQYYCYPKANVWNYLSRKVETQYEGGKPMKPVVTDYTYNSENYQTSKSTRRQGEQVIEDRYQYSVDGVSAGSDLLINKHVLSRLTGTRQYLNGKLTGGAQLDFREHDTLQHDRIPVVEMFRNILPNGKMDTVLTVVDYDERGNIREYVTKNGTHTTILWSHNYQYPVMQIVGATYEEVKRAYHAISVIGKQKTIPLSMMKTLHNKFSAIKEGELQVTAYVYDPWYGVSDIIQPNGKVMHYDKDSQGRLSKILEDSATGPVVQRFFYHYRNR